MDKEYLLAKPQGRCNERFIKKNFPEEYKKILLCFGDKFAEKLYNYLYNSPSHICPVCGKETPFRTIIYGYSEYCSVECSYKCELRNEKIKNTCLNKYGVENVSQNDTIKQKKKETVTRNYGGVGFASKTIKEKASQTLFENHGVTNPYQINRVRENAHKKYYEKFLKENPLVLSISTFPNIEYICKCNNKNCNKCGKKQFTISNIAYNNRKYSDSELCTILSPEDSSKYKNTSIEIFIKSLLDKYNINYQTNVRNIIYPYELDIYIPEKKIAIECNGVYWHSDKNKEKNYHYNKYSECKEKGIQLISIWEDQVINSSEKVESIILSKLGIYNKRIYARKCEIKEIPSKKCREFLDKYHLQGSTNSSIRLGLYDKNELVGVMTFGKGRKCLNSNTNYELYRYCCKAGIQVIGGSSKLFTHFVKKYNPEIIESFSSNDISNGNLYEKLEFKYTSDSISYWYIDKKFTRYHRYKFTKYNLVKESFDPNKTEFEIMDERGFYRIYDSGQTKWTYTNSGK
jgi:very-short-patch-repair endonuclease